MTHRQIMLVIIGLMAGMFLSSLDQTIVSTAIRTIGDDLHGLEQQAWVTTAYMITSTITTPIYGKLSDTFGRRTLFFLAILIFLGGSLLCGVALHVCFEKAAQGAKASLGDVLAALADTEFGGAQLLFNNAGVALAGPIWTSTEQDWSWALGVNLMGVAHGIRAFVPRMLKRGGESHVVNTASVAGLLSVPGSSIYSVSKHGVVAMSECLHHELQAAGARIGVSVLCPAFVSTGIADAARNRPGELAASNPEAAAYEERVRQAVRKGKISAADVASMTIEAVKQGRFYILTHPNIKPAIEMRLRDILDEALPRNPMP